MLTRGQPEAVVNISYFDVQQNCIVGFTGLPPARNI